MGSKIQTPGVGLERRRRSAGFRWRHGVIPIHYGRYPLRDSTNPLRSGNRQLVCPRWKPEDWQRRDHSLGDQPRMMLNDVGMSSRDVKGLVAWYNFNRRESIRKIQIIIEMLNATNQRTGSTVACGTKNPGTRSTTHCLRASLTPPGSRWSHKSSLGARPSLDRMTSAWSCIFLVGGCKIMTSGTYQRILSSGLNVCVGHWLMDWFDGLAFVNAFKDPYLFES